MGFPVASTCVCCDVQSGAVCILVLNLIQNFFCFVVAFLAVLLGAPTLDYSASSSSEVATAAWCLVGIPIILFALAGIRQRNSELLRFYLAYMAASFLIDFFFLGDMLLWKAECDKLYRFGQTSNSAWQCGMVQTSSGVLFFVLTLVMFYAMWIVWSVCQHLDFGGSSSIIADVLHSRDAWHKQKQMKWIDRLAAVKRQKQEVPNYTENYGTPDMGYSDFHRCA